LARTKTARSTAAGGEVRASPKMAWARSISTVLAAASMIGAAIWNHLTPDVHADGLTDFIAVAFTLAAVYTIASVRVGYTRLLSDRVEHRELFRERVLPRVQVAGYRPQLATKQICLVAVPGAKDLVVPLHVVENPVWTAWLDTLKDLDVEDHNAAIEVLETDARLGRNPDQRLRTLGSLHRLTARLSWGGLALAIWLFIYPRPYELAILVGVGHAPDRSSGGEPLARPGRAGQRRGQRSACQPGGLLARAQPGPGPARDARHPRHRLAGADRPGRGSGRRALRPGPAYREGRRPPLARAVFGDRRPGLGAGGQSAWPMPCSTALRPRSTRRRSSN
jgi:hypothetical protein